MTVWMLAADAFRVWLCQARLRRGVGSGREDDARRVESGRFARAKGRYARRWQMAAWRFPGLPCERRDAPSGFSIVAACDLDVGAPSRGETGEHPRGRP